MPDFKPLTPEQYTTARSKFSPEQILQFEQKRRADSTAGQPPAPVSGMSQTGSPTDSQLQKNEFDSTSQAAFGDGLAKKVMSPVVGFGNSIAGAASNVLPKSMTGIGDMEKSQQDYGKDTTNLLNIIKDRKSKGMDTSSLETALKNEVTPAQWKDLYPSITKTKKQVIGEAAGTGLLAMSGGGLTAGVKSGVMAASEAAIPSLTRTLAAGATVGGVGGVSNAMQKNESNKDIVKSGLAGATIGAATGGLAYGFGKLLENAGSKILNTVIKPSRADINDGFSMDTVKKYDLGGNLSTIYDKTEGKLNDLSKQLREKLADSDSSIDMANVYDYTVASLSKKQLQNFGHNTSIDTALEQLQNEVLNVNPSGELSIPDAQLVKQSAGRMGAWQFGVKDPAATARETVYNAFYKNLKIEIENKSPAGVKEINRQLGELIPVANAVLRRIPVEARNSALSLSDMVSLTGSIIDPSAGILSAISLAQKSGTAGNLISKLGTQAVKQSAKIGAASGFGTSKLKN